MEQDQDGVQLWDLVHTVLNLQILLSPWSDVWPYEDTDKEFNVSVCVSGRERRALWKSKGRKVMLATVMDRSHLEKLRGWKLMLTCSHMIMSSTMAIWAWTRQELHCLHSSCFISTCVYDGKTYQWKSLFIFVSEVLLIYRLHIVASTFCRKSRYWVTRFGLYLWIDVIKMCGMTGIYSKDEYIFISLRIPLHNLYVTASHWTPPAQWSGCVPLWFSPKNCFSTRSYVTRN
jgi:hypothetical protein